MTDSNETQQQQCGCGACPADNEEQPLNPFERLADATARLDLINEDIKSIDEQLSILMSDLNHKRHERKLGIEEFKAAYKAFGESVAPAFFA